MGRVEVFEEYMAVKQQIQSLAEIVQNPMENITADDMARFSIESNELCAKLCKLRKKVFGLYSSER